MKMKKMTATKEGETKNLNYVWLWCMIFGMWYFLYNSAWKWALIYTLIFLVTFGYSAFIFPFFARSIMRKHFESDGWVVHHE